MSSTTRQVVDGTFYEPSGEREDREEGDNNDQKYGDGSKNNNNMSASATSIQNLLNRKKQDIANAKHFEYEFLNSGHIKKIKW